MTSVFGLLVISCLFAFVLTAEPSENPLMSSETDESPAMSSAADDSLGTSDIESSCDSCTSADGSSVPAPVVYAGENENPDPDAAGEPADSSDTTPVEEPAEEPAEEPVEEPAEASSTGAEATDEATDEVTSSTATSGTDEVVPTETSEAPSEETLPEASVTSSEETPSEASVASSEVTQSETSETSSDTIVPSVDSSEISSATATSSPESSEIPTTPSTNETETTTSGETSTEPPPTNLPDFSLTFQGDFDKLVTNETIFIEQFQEQIADQLGINASFIVVTGVRKGSIIVDFNVIDEESKKTVATKLPAMIDSGKLAISVNGETVKAIPKPVEPENPVTKKPPPNPMNLKRTDIIVICVAAVICILLIILGIIVCCRECRKRSGTKYQNTDPEGSYRHISLEEFNAIPRPQVKYDANGHDDLEKKTQTKETDKNQLLNDDRHSGGVDNPAFRNSQNEPKTTF